MVFRIPRAWCNAEDGSEVQQVRDEIRKLQREYRRARRRYERYAARAPPCFQTLERLARVHYSIALRELKHDGWKPVYGKEVYPKVLDCITRRTPGMDSPQIRADNRMDFGFDPANLPRTDSENTYSAIRCIGKCACFSALTSFDARLLEEYHEAGGPTVIEETYATLLATRTKWISQ